MGRFFDCAADVVFLLVGAGLAVSFALTLVLLIVGGFPLLLMISLLLTLFRRPPRT